MEEQKRTRTRRSAAARIVRMDDDETEIEPTTTEDVLMAIKAIEAFAVQYVEGQRQTLALLERQCMAMERMEKHALYMARAAASTRKWQGEVERGLAHLVHVAAIYLETTGEGP